MSERLISLGRTHELCLCRDISLVQRMSEIALHKNNECILQPRLIKHELVLVFFHDTHNKIRQLGIEHRIHNRKCS